MIPLLLSTDEFADAWRDWLQHRREIKKPVKPGSKTEIEQLKMLERWGQERAIAAIRFTIMKGWMGIAEENSRQAHNGIPPGAGATSQFKGAF